MELRRTYPAQYLMDDVPMDPATPKSRLARKREELGYTQEQLAELVGTTSKSVGNWETGKHRPRGQHLRRLSHTLGLSPGDILEEEASSSQLDRIEGIVSEIHALLTSAARQDAESFVQAIRAAAERYGTPADTPGEGHDDPPGSNRVS